MKTVIVMCDPDRIDSDLISSLRRLFPECEIRIVFAQPGAMDIDPVALSLKNARA